MLMALPAPCDALHVRFQITGQAACCDNDLNDTLELYDSVRSTFAAKRLATLSSKKQAAQ